MRSRKDTFVVAAKLILAANEIVMKNEIGGLASVAVINSRPQNINPLSGEVDKKLNLRHQPDEGVQELKNDCKEQFDKIN